ncbi:hypothetical protein [Tropicimonas isoalkanivorans]|uniref:Uncharacterized protein n=1 Tax=Tropicimonas isoalkanivorans TaxID=441112 RepID=A0A1I1DRA9_9RHOB|nr:hypothetical protein [Tropicimonas isoalkanivorans]SFB75230.1 hypothetical protein SAMN04488094_101292 [Tropicimonas isoalkanivorans]
MLDILGLIAGNILNLPGILGLALGMTTRQPIIGAVLGALVGVVSTYIFFTDLGISQLASPELTIAVIIGAMFGALGSLIRRKGALV